MEFSKLIGKQLLTPEGNLIGYTIGCFLSDDLSAPVCLACADEEEEEFFLPFEAVKKSGDVLIAENARIPAATGIACPVGKAVFDESGNFLGVAGALTSGSAGVLTVITSCGEKEYSAKRLFVGDKVILRAKTVSSNKRPLKPRSPEEKKISPDFSSDEIYRNNLMGKRVKNPLPGIAKEGEIVTAEMIARAHENNRLLELTACTLLEDQTP